MIVSPTAELLRHQAGIGFCLYCSSNRLTTLADFAHCLNLESLYLRNNSVSDLSELRHLEGLSRLRVLWLEGNPCSKHLEYRSTLLRMLPKIQRLDNTGSSSNKLLLVLLLLLLWIYNLPYLVLKSRWNWGD